MKMEKLAEIRATGNTNERKKFIIIAAAAVLLIIICFAFIAPSLKKDVMPDVIDLRGEKAEFQILETGTTEDRIVFKEIEDGKALADCKEYTGDIHKVFVFETNPESGKSFHINTDIVNVGVKTVDNIVYDTVGSNPEVLFSLSDKYDFEFNVINTYQKTITDLVKKDPTEWIIKEIINYDPSANRISFSVTGTKEYEETIRKEEDARIAEEKQKAEEAKKADEAKRKQEEENADGMDDGDGDTSHFTGDKDKKYKKWGGYTWSRPVSYNEMVEIFDTYTKLYYSTEIDMDNFEEEDAELGEKVAEQYDITYDDFMSIFGVIDNEVVVAIRQKYQTMKEMGML